MKIYSFIKRSKIFFIREICRNVRKARVLSDNYNSIKNPEILKF